MGVLERESLDQTKLQSYETREVIDCVDIYKQPAFDHPLLKNHTIQMKPSSNLKANGSGSVEGVLNQAWRKYGECPEGTIPIIRPQSHTSRHAIRSNPHLKWLNKSRLGSESDGHESLFYIGQYAVVYLNSGNFKGAHATINVWNPVVLDQEASFSQIWLTAGPRETVNTIEAGWRVDPGSSPKGAKLFIYWTGDGYWETGCYNLECPGFVQTSDKIALGVLLQPFSTYGGKQYDITVDIEKNQPLERWWLRIQDVDVGYWPQDLFTSLKDRADKVAWGGEVVNLGLDGRHTSTQMGSGHLPSEGFFGKASFFRHVSIVDGGSFGRDPENLQKRVSKPGCYDLIINEAERSQLGVNFYYGGPGYSAQCEK
ncbi:uncharacterized protein LOC104424189 [Eucalyptus grandis]|uniref:uncharacterized protein LOC104424189 n=1 Tax=Eucalyptus grandis TaxID=71139 RepID=UPI00192EC506|nr:uncharacterized protein LOC104424189 [Eucalyptus grandis]